MEALIVKDLIFDLQRFADGDPAGTQQATEPNTGGDPTGTQQAQAMPAQQTALGGDPSPQNSNIPESYDFTDVLKEAGIEADDTSIGEFTEILKGMGASQDQAVAMAKYGLGYAQSVADAVAQGMQQRYIDEVKGWGETMKQELGGQYDATLGKAAITRDYIEQKVPGFKEMLNISGVGNHVTMVKAMALLSELVGEDPGKMGGAGGSAGSQDLYPNTDFSKY